MGQNLTVTEMEMLPSEPLILLIDGNNLAHFLYTNLAAGQKMTPADGQRLIEHISNYARSYPDEIKIELCLDRSPGSTQFQAGNMRIFYAEYPQTADDLLLGRFWFHHIDQRPCVVITNDEAILGEVRAAHGAVMRVYDFVRRPGLVAPVFRAPDELPATSRPSTEDLEKEPALSLGTSIYFRIAGEEGQPEKGNAEKVNRSIRRSVILKEVQDARPEPPVVRETAVRAEENALEEPDEYADSTGSSNEEVPREPSEEGPYYFLTIENWPIGEGVRFLLNSFCPRHRAEYQDLLAAFDRAALRPIDLRALAELLLHACGNEPGFAHQGALMARVRLALLQARGEPLTLEEIAERTGLKLPGLRGRIKAKAGRWLEIL